MRALVGLSSGRQRRSFGEHKRAASLLLLCFIQHPHFSRRNTRGNDLPLRFLSLCFCAIMASSFVSNGALPDHIFNLPANMQPQPALTRFWCEACVSALSTTSAGDPNGTVPGLYRVCRTLDSYCVRKNNFGVCDGCRRDKKGGCVEVRSVEGICRCPSC